MPWIHSTRHMPHTIKQTLPKKYHLNDIHQCYQFTRTKTKWNTNCVDFAIKLRFSPPRLYEEISWVGFLGRVNFSNLEKDHSDVYRHLWNQSTGINNKNNCMMNSAPWWYSTEYLNWWLSLPELRYGWSSTLTLISCTSEWTKQLLRCGWSCTLIYAVVPLKINHVIARVEVQPWESPLWRVPSPENQSTGINYKNNCIVNAAPWW